MLQDIMKSDSLVQLSLKQQELLLGGQGQPFNDQFIQPLAVIRGQPITALGQTLNDGSSTVLGNNTLQGSTTSGLFGSVGNSTAQGKGGATGAEDIMILPPFSAASQTL
ncbi:hypothetical protein PN497_16655 [Sphaerospermopsis kisseleviana CS-549]|uniref:Uncharacterized protein n=1 Tax=Sphaerospermopsis kisseleviana CS-549 TaxID=3021783 RepID=A0ABT4ZU81_9CYAN|nr:hypothetical protein [Sphaerospermopsis kisseleviana]MDB9442979.1 hypothetical protein [Sphaerospermopsis kisseleviana CS-549]BAZ81265.1 hypothetical protein NIES73_25320 [Sphaerospermopsis kisseleviana NIES-73]